MRILHIARWCCIRTYKQVLAQQSAGMNVTVMAGSTGHPELHAMIEKAIGWQTEAAMRSLVSAYDCIVVHTTIDTHGDATAIPYAIEPTAKRLVWDVHDFVDASPKALYDAVVVPSKGYADKFNGKATVVYSKVPECLMPADYTSSHLWDRIRATALNATLCINEPWGNYSGLQAECDHLFIYPNGDDISGHEHMNIMRRLPYSRLLTALCQYTHHWCGSANPEVTIHDCVTNKFWECLACGSTPLLRNSDEMQALLDSCCYDVVPPVMEDEVAKMMVAYNL